MPPGKSSPNTVLNADKKYPLPTKTAPDAALRRVMKEGEKMTEFQMSREQLLSKYGFGPEAMKKIKDYLDRTNYNGIDTDEY